MEDLTFGSGRLDSLGFWEFPCSLCARAWEEKNPGDKTWPLPGQDVAALTLSIQEDLAREEKDNLAFDCWLDG